MGRAHAHNTLSGGKDSVYPIVSAPAKIAPFGWCPNMKTACHRLLLGLLLFSIVTFGKPIAASASGNHFNEVFGEIYPAIPDRKNPGVLVHVRVFEGGGAVQVNGPTIEFLLEIFSELSTGTVFKMEVYLPGMFSLAGAQNIWQIQRMEPPKRVGGRFSYAQYCRRFNVPRFALAVKPHSPINGLCPWHTSEIQDRGEWLQLKGEFCPFPRFHRVDLRESGVRARFGGRYGISQNLSLRFHVDRLPSDRVESPAHDYPLVAHLKRLASDVEDSCSTYPNASDSNQGENDTDSKRHIIERIFVGGFHDPYVVWDVLLGFGLWAWAVGLLYPRWRDWRGWLLVGLSVLCFVRLSISLVREQDCEHRYSQMFQYDAINVSQKHLTVREFM
jgi:hypothetical protein